MATSSAAPSRAVVTPEEQRQIDAKLLQVLKIKGNDSCADCGTKHPRWASVNLGKQQQQQQQQQQQEQQEAEKEEQQQQQEEDK